MSEVLREAIGWLKLRRRIYEDGNVKHLVEYIDMLIKAAESTLQQKCPLGENCDLTIAYMKGFEDGKDAVRRHLPAAPEEVKS